MRGRGLVRRSRLVLVWWLGRRFWDWLLDCDCESMFSLSVGFKGLRA
jgi:hypothetical protein